MSDDIALGWNLPAPATKEELLETLEEIRKGIEADESLEGFFNFQFVYDEPWLYPAGTKFDEYGTPARDEDGSFPQPIAPFGLMARWRTGNQMGQGGVTAYIKDWPEGVQVMEQDRDRTPWELRRMLKSLRRELQRIDAVLATSAEDPDLARRGGQIAATIGALEYALGRRDDIMEVTTTDA
jgi:hypothetical protein